MSTGLSESLLDGFSIIANSAVSNSSNDVTIECEVTRIIDSAKGVYTVQYTENKFTANALNGASYAIGDSVYVLIPQGNFSNTKIILGLSRAAVLRSESQEIDYHNEISDNLLTNIADVELCTYHSEVKDLDFDDDFIGAILANYQHFELKCDVKTNIIDLAQRVNGNYGIKITIPVVDELGVQSTIERAIDIYNMNGDVYNFENFITQRLYFDCDGTKYDSSRKIGVSAFVTNFKQDDSITTPDIFIKNIEFKAVEVLSEEDLQGYYLTIKSTDSFLFLKGKYETDKILTPYLKIQGVSADVRDFECYWFKEDASIDIDNEYYNTNGGRGWRILNPRTQTGTNEDGVATYDYNKNVYTLVVKESDIIAAARYKCVLVNSTISLHKVVSIVNLNSDLSFSLTTSSGSTSFIRDVGVVNLIAKLHYPGSTENITFDYLFQRFDKNGNYLDNDFYTKIVWDEVDGENRATKISYPVGDIDEFNTIKCEFVRKRVQDDVIYYESIGTSSITLTTGYEVYDYYLSLSNEDILYKYDANGNSPMVANYDGPYQSKIEEIKPISVRVFKTIGYELDTSEYNYLDMTWAFPKNSMMDLEGYTLSELDQDDDYYYIKGKNITDLSYSIKDTYDNTKVDNTILITAIFDNTELKTKATITFLKDGESGTNGSQYAAVIKYNINDDQGHPQWYAYGEKDQNGVPQKIRLVYVVDTWKRYLTRPSIDEDSQYVNFGTPTFSIKLYKNGKLIPYDTENPVYSVYWNMLDETETNAFFEMNNQGVLSVKNQWTNPDIISVNIIQAAITINESSDTTTGEEYVYAYYPIDIVRLNSNQKFVPEIAGGYDTVKYDSDGTNPQYNTNKKFKINVVDGRTDFFENTWESSDSLFEEEDEETENKLEVGFRPISQMTSGDSNNYIKVNLTQTNANIAELNAEVAALTQRITELRNQIAYYTNEKSYLYDFLSHFSYDDYLARLISCEKYLAYRSEYIRILINLIEVLENIEFLDSKYDFSNEKNEITVIYNSLRNAHDIDDFYSYTRKLDLTGVENPSVIGLMNSFNSKIDDGLKAYDDLINYSELTNELNIYNSIIEDIQDLPNYMTDLCSEHDQGPANETFLNIKSQITIYGNYFGNIQQGWTKDWILGNIIKSIEDLLTTYRDSTFINNYYNKKIEELNTELTEKRTVLANSDQSVFDAAIVIKPILFLLNRYGLAFINGWDGNKLYTGDKDEFLLAPQIGAGKKEEGKFTGIVMGVRVKGSDREEIGLVGKYQGEDSIFLDAETGNAIFGKAGEGQIKMIPGGTSTIAGWEIDEYSLGKTYGNRSVYLYSGQDEDEAVYPPKPDGSGDYTEPKYIAFQALTELNDSNKDDPTTYITYDGYLYSNQAYIEGNIRADAGFFGGWSIIGDGIAEKEGSDAFIRAGKTSADDENEGFYLSASAFSIGDSNTYLKYNEEGLTIVGKIEADTGRIGPFHVNEEYIWTEYNDKINFILGEEGICLGGYGKFFLGEKYVGDEVIINDDYSYQGGTIIHSNGGVQTDCLTIMNNRDLNHSVLPNPDATGLYIDLAQGEFPSSNQNVEDDSPADEKMYPLQLHLIGCSAENELVGGAAVGLWSEGRFILGELDYGFRNKDRSSDFPYYAFKCAISGNLYIRKNIYLSFGEEGNTVWKVTKKKKSDINDDDYCLIAKEWGTFQSKEKDLPAGPGSGNAGGSSSISADIITFDTSVLGGA